ncbi:putative prenylcysteine lyase [Aspergillus glaucus CBS 516.65]|uniref:Prenylcysteine lyase domain-containing protein n=1 Tax=Aspergillus glaucus CBS 516.65 TaxID=1160497 RepID=A0A1L9V3V6_ASPGL|nr:hypothetical protein ASPGLDRAFT_138540 [Aspergillus glaucus CBS 516.65]OJJ78625.1 hypothetical protein ASPGLDRAFT_138540 [Aspergillus glaucus CBS 516.65]
MLSRLFLIYQVILLLIPFSNADDQQPLHATAEATPKRVAVIGAGAAGSSNAYFLRKYAESSQTPVDVTVFERSSYIGGRSTTVDVFDNPAYPVELGASIFVEVNYNLVNASRDLGLVAQGADIARPKESDDSIGIWDGKEFVVTLQNTSSWWNIGKILWRYWLAPIKAQNLMKSTVKKFLSLYEEPMFPFPSLSDAAEKVGLLNATASPGEDFLERNGISADFGREVIQASTRVNYGQNLPQIHGLETMVCMAAEGAVSIEGGNWRIFDGMLKSSSADVKLNTTVTSIERNNVDDTLTIKSVSEDHANKKQEHSNNVFDEVVIAGPLQYSGIHISPPLEHTPDEIPYVTLHVTLFSSPHKLSPQFFGLGPNEQTPETILTTLPKETNLGTEKPGAGPAGFWSISSLRTVTTENNERHYVYKIFSPERLTGEFVAQVLGFQNSTAVNGESTIADLPKTDISWFHEKIWHPYPFLYPRVTFEEPNVAPNLWYTGGIESFISTMETSSLMGKNVAALMVQSWKGQDTTSSDEQGRDDL